MFPNSEVAEVAQVCLYSSDHVLCKHAALLVHKQILCYKTSPCAVTKKKIGRGGGVQEQHLKDKSTDKGMNQTLDDDYTVMDMNPAYQST